jgi:uncharacterized protein (DUF39 family)
MCRAFFCAVARLFSLWAQDSEDTSRGRPKWRRRFDKVTLREIDAAVAQPVEVLLMLNLLCHKAELHGPRQLDHGGDHLLIDLVRGQIVRVGTVDLEVVDQQVLEARERTEAAAEVIK